MNFDELKSFQNRQKEIVAFIGAFILPLKAFSESIVVSGIDELNETRKLQPIVSAFCSNLGPLAQFCDTYHYPTYIHEIRRPALKITTLLGKQTLPSQKIPIDQFKLQIDTHIASIGEVMIALAQIVAPSFDINIKAGNSFSAYCFFSSLFDNVSSNFHLIDPYIDEEIFYRYLYRLDPQSYVKIFTDQTNLKQFKLAQLESIEKLFKSEYPNYKREQRDSLHDRYLITDTKAYSLGGSLKDASRNADFSVIEVSDEKRDELLQIYA